MSSHSSFSKGFQKVAAPAWLHRMHSTLTPAKNIKNHSKVGLKNIKAMKEIVKK